MKGRINRWAWSAFTLLALTAALQSASVTRAQPSLRPDPRFGAVENFWVPAEAQDMGVGWERILFYWREIQPAGPDDWNTLHVREEWLVEAQAQGQTIVGLLKNTPAWATDGLGEAGVPRGLYLPVDDPSNLWANFLRRVARYYGPRGVHHWIIWNEPEIRPGVYGYEFGGSVDDYRQLLRVAYLVLKQEDPQAVVHLAGLTWWHDPGYLDRLLAAITTDPEAGRYDHYFDVLSLHIYFQPETIPLILSAVDDVQQRRGLSKPIWINETNASPNLDPGWPVTRPRFQVDLDQQAWFVVQAFVMGFTSGASRIAVYKMLDIHLPPGGESFGLLRPDKSRRPAFYAFQTSVRFIGGFTQAERRSTATIHLGIFNRPEGVTRVIWNRTNRAVSVEIPALAPTARLVSATGGTVRTLIARNNTYTLDLPPARCRGNCEIGGPPLFVIETDVQPEDPGLATATMPQAAVTAVNGLATATMPQAAVATVNGLATAAAAPSGGATPSPRAPSTPQADTRPTAGVSIELTAIPSPPWPASVSPTRRGPTSTPTAPALAPARSGAAPVPLDASVTRSPADGQIGLWLLASGALLALALAIAVARRAS